MLGLIPSGMDGSGVFDAFERVFDGFEIQFECPEPRASPSPALRTFPLRLVRRVRRHRQYRCGRGAVAAGAAAALPPEAHGGMEGWRVGVSVGFDVILRRLVGMSRGFRWMFHI